MRKIFAVALLVVATAAWGQNYPTRAVRIIVPSPPAGGTDIVGRVLAEHFTKAFGQQFFVENKPGAGNMIGIEAAARSAPDGYTLLMTASTLALNSVLYKKVPYDPVKDFAPITLAATAPNILIVNPALAVHTTAELIAIIVGSGGVGRSAVQLGHAVLVEAGGALRWIARQPVAALTGVAGVGMARAVVIHAALELGRLMYESHGSYGACGLGSDGTDRLVDLVAAEGPEHGLFGAKITGGGSGGTVAILGTSGAEGLVRDVAGRYRAETGREAAVFTTSGPGAAETGVLCLTQLDAS